MKKQHLIHSGSARDSQSPHGLLLALALGLALCAGAQSYQIDWHTVDGGGGTSTGGVFLVSGTVGQPDAGTLTGGNFAVTGGFWSVVAAIQSPGAPYLLVLQTITNTVVIWWPLPDTEWRLQSTANLSSPSWTDLPPPYSTAGTNLWVTAPCSSGNRFYRLYKPAAP